MIGSRDAGEYFNLVLRKTVFQSVAWHPPIVAEIGRSVITPIKPGIGSERILHSRESGESIDFRD